MTVFQALEPYEFANSDIENNSPGIAHRKAGLWGLLSSHNQGRSRISQTSEEYLPHSRRDGMGIIVDCSSASSSPSSDACVVLRALQKRDDAADKWKEQDSDSIPVAESV